MVPLQVFGGDAILCSIVCPPPIASCALDSPRNIGVFGSYGRPYHDWSHMVDHLRSCCSKSSFRQAVQVAPLPRVTSSQFNADKTGRVATAVI